jgi:hypothetical protein
VLNKTENMLIHSAKMASVGEMNFLTENWPTILKTFDPPVN